MKRKITCFCDNTFDVDIPEEINLDSASNYLEEISKGSFLNYTCPGCGKKHKPEFPLIIHWPSKKICFEVFPELERGEFYRRKKPPVSKNPYPMETLIGYPEMADRLAVIRDGYEPAPVEAIKYFLQLKAEEQYPDDELEVWYYSTNQDDSETSGSKGTGSSGDQSSLEFHIHGIRQNEVAVMKVPISLYKKSLEDFKKHPKNEIYSALRVRSYLSVKNTMRPEELK